jgi:hypothetical protein
VLERRHDELTHVALVERAGAGRDLVLQVGVFEPQADQLHERAAGSQLARAHALVDPLCEQFLELPLGGLRSRAGRLHPSELAVVIAEPGERTRPPAGLQAPIDLFAHEYNHRRPHRSLPHRATPATLYDSMPKALPGPITDPATHERIRNDRVDKAGSVTLRHNSRLHHIGIGRTHAGTCIILLIQDLQIRVVNAATGELLRDLILDATRDYQPTRAPKGPTNRPPK